MQLARCGKNRIYEAVARGELRAIKLGPRGTRIPKHALLIWMSDAASQAHDEVTTSSPDDLDLPDQRPPLLLRGAPEK
jgi:excisionase family DNA binding protein